MESIVTWADVIDQHEFRACQLWDYALFNQDDRYKKLGDIHCELAQRLREALT